MSITPKIFHPAFNIHNIRVCNCIFVFLFFCGLWSHFNDQNFFLRLNFFRHFTFLPPLEEISLFVFLTTQRGWYLGDFDESSGLILPHNFWQINRFWKTFRSGISRLFVQAIQNFFFVPRSWQVEKKTSFSKKWFVWKLTSFLVK